MIPIPSIIASDGLDAFDGMQPPIKRFFQNERIDHALHIAACNHDEKMTLLVAGLAFLFL